MISYERVKEAFHYDPRATKPYRAQISINGETKYLGYFASPEEASEAFQKAHAKRWRQYELEA